jgi:hypothetical protein
MRLFSSALLLLALLASPIIVFGQEEDFEFNEPKPKIDNRPSDNYSIFNAGVIAGANFCQIDGDDEVGFLKIGPNVGVWGAVRFHRRWMVNVELLYTMRGSYATFKTAYNRPLDWTYNYAEVPIYVSFLEYKAIDKKNKEFMRIAVKAGLSGAYMLGGSEVTNGFAANDENFANAYKTYDVSGILGGTFFFTRHIGLDVRYQWSLVPFGQSWSLGRETFHRLIGTRLFYQF